MADHDHAHSLGELKSADLKSLNIKRASKRLSTGGGFLSVVDGPPCDFKRKSFDTSNKHLAAILPTPKGNHHLYQALKEKVIELQIEE